MNTDTYWQAVLTRDRRYDGEFVYAVRSTGIYCRPTCSSRRPQREQVDFFAQPTAAQQAGYRPCRRCRPDQPPVDLQQEMVEQVCRYIADHLDRPLTLQELGDQVHVSPTYLQRVFKHYAGITPRQYADACRVSQVKVQLRQGGSVNEALYEAGYSSSSRLYERAPDQLGMTPGDYRRGGQGMHIGYTIVDCRLGRILVAATQRGICAVSFGEEDASLEKALRAEYPSAEIHRDNSGFSQWVNALVSHLDGQQPHLDLPIDVQATAFQRRVWQELQAIPYGSTRTYRQIATTVGQPTAARAVARACATNPVSIVVPCHRVVREDGGLGGYRWGLERKQWLLEQEKGNT